MSILKYYKDHQSLSFQELLEVTGLNEQELLANVDQLISDRRLQKLDDGNYALYKNLLVGRLDVKETFAFLIQPGEDLFLQDKDIKDALDDDIVLVHVGKINKVIDVLERNVKRLVVHVSKLGNKNIYLPIKPFKMTIELNEETQTFYGGEVLLLEVVSYEKKKVVCKIIQILGNTKDPGMDILELVYQFEWPHEFSKDVLDYTESLDRTIKHDDRFIVNNELIVTIDGTDAKDLDDAVSLQIIDDYYHLSVHIADVSAYVEENTVLDDAALERATSVYLADRVIPMLPKRLSNDLCSLNANEEKYALSLFMKINRQGDVVSHELKQTVITVNKRLNYQEVNRYLDYNEPLYSKEIEEMMTHMHDLSKILEHKRVLRGALNFKSDEFKYDTDEFGNILDIHLAEVGHSEGIIESFMVLANETVSMHLSSLNLPCIYRVHDKPDQDKLINVLDLIKSLGIKIPRINHVTPKALQLIIEKIEEHPLEHVIHTLLLRSMKKAVYSENNIGHYGLASTYYSHFTSPIRRYPDLLLHRLIRRFLLNPTDIELDYKHFEMILPTLAKHSSDMEKKADDLEREVDKLKTTEFMESHKNEIFETVISSITASGMFVRLDNGIEGMVPLRLLDDYFIFNPKELSLIGKRTKHVFKIGQKIEVKLIEVDVKLRQLTFKLNEGKGERNYENRRHKQKGNA